MILITRGQANTVTLTLNEKVTLSSPKFLFRCINQVTKSAKTFIATDTSSYPYRYNEFTITESDSESLLNGTVQLKPPGLWRYEVYEQSSTTNLDYTLSDNRVETGILRVIGSTQTYKSPNNSQTYLVYDRGTV